MALFSLLKEYLIGKKSKNLPMSCNIQPGDRFYSDYFKCHGTVVKCVSDSDWWFILDNTLAVMHAQCHTKKLRWVRREQ